MKFYASRANTIVEKNTVSGRIGKVSMFYSMVASSAEGCIVDSRQRLTDLYCAQGAQGVLPIRVGGNGQSIRSTVSDAFVRSWLWSTAT